MLNQKFRSPTSNISSQEHTINSNQIEYYQPKHQAKSKSYNSLNKSLTPQAERSYKSAKYVNRNNTLDNRHIELSRKKSYTNPKDRESHVQQNSSSSTNTLNLGLPAKKSSKSQQNLEQSHSSITSISSSILPLNLSLTETKNSGTFSNIKFNSSLKRKKINAIAKAKLEESGSFDVINFLEQKPAAVVISNNNSSISGPIPLQDLVPKTKKLNLSVTETLSPKLVKKTYASPKRSLTDVSSKYHKLKESKQKSISHKDLNDEKGSHAEFKILAKKGQREHKSASTLLPNSNINSPQLHIKRKKERTIDQYLETYWISESFCYCNILHVWLILS